MDMINQFHADFMMLLSGVCGIMAFFAHHADHVQAAEKDADGAGNVRHVRDDR